MTTRALHAAALLALASLLSLGGCFIRCGGPPTSAAGGFNPIAALGAETWKIDATPREVAATYYLHLPEGFQFTIEAPVVASPPSDPEAALEQAWPYMRYAYTDRRHLRTVVSKAGEGDLPVNRIGVALVLRNGAQTSFHRVSLTLEEIESRIKGGM